jgi:hypothetical protein
MRLFGMALLWSIFLVVFIGCGGGEPAKVTEPDNQSSQESPAQPAEAESTTSEPEAPSPPTSLVHKRGGKDWIGDVPLDVWFDDPLAVASTAGNVAPVQPNDAANVSNTPVQPMPMPMPMPMPKETPVA